MTDDVEGADTRGIRSSVVVQGDAALVQQRMQGCRMRRSKRAVFAALDAAAKLAGRQPVPAPQLASDFEAVRKHEGLVPKSLEKIACDERLWDAFLFEHPMPAKDKYPSVEHVVKFAAWTTRTRQRACLAQRDDTGPERQGLARHTTRVVLTQLDDHVWERRYGAFARLPDALRTKYWADVLEQFDSIHKLSVHLADGSEGDERAAQLAVQTAPATQRKNFYTTEVHQLQDWCLQQQEAANSAALLDAALAIVQTTAARPGMFTKDCWDGKSARWSKENPLRVR
eukprot:CAMPEP_0119339682 /NCGR_PEP_ID=MMETSP1333-20130426/98802_1 /TAXON_ID=418940 /ORGANISM="Scyphosphaera apsteinii, Strain RCC1455" /LENGTH=283 /DNA_ID=CAMNT_0007351261 /DNA_START=116 /DNA_END=963 /DNA_ORIENTATION=+